MLWYEQSLTPSELKFPDFNVSSRYFFSESDVKWVFGDSNEYFYKERELQAKKQTTKDPAD